MPAPTVQLAFTLTARDSVSRRGFTNYLRSLLPATPAGIPGLADKNPISCYLYTLGRVADIYCDDWIEYHNQDDAGRFTLGIRRPLPEWARLFGGLVNDERGEYVSAGRCLELLALVP